jgi:hypothetical protein
MTDTANPALAFAPLVNQRSDNAWLGGATAHGAQNWLDNAHGQVLRLDLADHHIPLMLTHENASTSYVASLPSAWVRYTVDEAMRHTHRLGLYPVRAALAPLLGLLRVANLHRAALLGNWLVSTNLYPQVAPAAWHQARHAAIAVAGQRPLAIRSVCHNGVTDLPKTLADDGWLLIPARLVYLCDPADARVASHHNVRRDRKLLHSNTVELLPPAALAEEDISDMRRCFRQVFIDKYSAYNPDFSDAFFRLCLEHRFLELYALRHADQLVGVLGVLERHGWVTAPLIGYDTTAALSLGLYRRLMALLLEQAAQRQCKLHYSSGAGQFKRVRGGTPVLEFTAVYVQHLPRHQQLATAAFAALMSRFGTRLLWRFG